MRRLLLALWIAAACTLDLQAQKPCQDDETVRGCQQRISNELDGSFKDQTAQAAEVATKVNRQNAQKPVPLDSAGGVATSSTKDLLPPLAMAVQSVKLDQKQQEAIIDFNWPSTLTPPGVALQLESIIRQPVLFDSVKKQVTNAQAQTLQDSLNDLNDVSVLLTVGVQNAIFGRRFSYNNDIFSRLFQAATKLATAPDVAKREDSLTEQCTKLGQIIEHTHSPTGEPKLKDYDAGRREALRDACTRDAVAQVESHARTVKALQDIQIAKLADLLNNQPQLLLTASRRIKDSLVGPNETNVQGSWEWSWPGHSLNSFRRSFGGANDQELIDGFEAFASDTKRTPRFKLTAQYTWLGAYSLVLPADSLDLHRARARRLTASLTYGQSLFFEKSSGQETGRIDVAAQYDNFSDDPQHKDRGTASITYTQQVSKGFSLPIGIVYANHDEFLSDVQKRFSAHFGLKMKLPFGNGS